MNSCLLQQENSEIATLIFNVKNTFFQRVFNPFFFDCCWWQEILMQRKNRVLDEAFETM